MHMSRSLKTLLKQIDDEVANDLLTSDNNEIGDYLSMRSGFMTYLPTNRIDVAEKKYSPRLRVRGKPAKIARKFCSQEHSDTAYEEFHNAFVGGNFSIKDMEIVKGNRIFEIYNKEYDKRSQSRRMRSCMVSEYRTQKDFEFYADNPQTVRLVVLWDRFKGQQVAVARALLWATEDGIYLDRVYGSDPGERFIKAWAKKKGFKTYSNVLESKTRVFIRKRKYDYFPYLDTFRSIVYTTRSGQHYIRS